MWLLKFHPSPCACTAVCRVLCCAVQDALYKPLLGQLARVSFFSAAAHQLVFTVFSTLPFAVGQPQVCTLKHHAHSYTHAL